MLDYQLAELYGVSTKQLNQAVKRNPERFPDNLMFRINSDELGDLRSQFVTAKSPSARNNMSRELPYAFTEHGVLMLASVLNSERAVQVSLALVNMFVKLRDHLSDPLFQRVHRLEQESAYVMQLFEDVFKRRKKIGLK